MKFGDKLRQYLVILCQFFGFGMIYVPSKALTEYISTGHNSIDVIRWSILALWIGIVILITGAIITQEGDKQDE